MMIEMDVRGGQNHGSGVVLNFGQLLREIRSVMVINNRQSPHHRLVGLNHLPEKRLPDQVADGLRAVGITPLGDQPVEFLQQVVFERNSCPA